MLPAHFLCACHDAQAFLLLKRLTTLYSHITIGDVVWTVLSLFLFRNFQEVLTQHLTGEHLVQLICTRSALLTKQSGQVPPTASAVTGNVSMSCALYHSDRHSVFRTDGQRLLHLYSVLQQVAWQLECVGLVQSHQSNDGFLNCTNTTGHLSVTLILP